MSDVTIREAGLTDAGTLAVLISEFNTLLGADGMRGAEAFAPENVNVGLDEMRTRLMHMQGIEVTYLAEAEGSPAGLCCLRLVPYIGQSVPYAEVTQLYVRPAFQRRGAGARLLHAAESRARWEGATCVHIITGNDNPSAQAFYRAQGYITETVVFDKFFDTEASHA